MKTVNTVADELRAQAEQYRKDARTVELTAVKLFTRAVDCRNQSEKYARLADQYDLAAAKLEQIDD